jgi:hypothetical protein
MTSPAVRRRVRAGLVSAGRRPVRVENEPHVAYFPEIQVAFNRIKKSGNSSTLVYLHGLIPSKQAQLGPKILHATKADALASTKPLKRCSVSDCIRLRKAWSFAVIREPYSRVLSAFLQKSLRPDYSGTPGFNDRTPSGFETFVRFLDDGGITANPHWWPQRDLLYFNPADIDVLSPLDRLDTGLRHLAAITGLRLPEGAHYGKPSLDEHRSGTKLTGSTALVHEFYPPDLRRIVHNLYSADFELYAMALDSLRSSRGADV